MVMCQYPMNGIASLCDRQNKADLANFLSQELIANTPADTCIITDGGLKKCNEVLSNQADIDVDDLKSTHEEPNTRVISNGMDTRSDTVVVRFRDTDVLLLLMPHRPTIKQEIIMKPRTAKAPKCIPVNDIVVSWDFTNDMFMSTVCQPFML